jgi:hypothetical protein
LEPTADGGPQTANDSAVGGLSSAVTSHINCNEEKQ